MQRLGHMRRGDGVGASQVGRGYARVMAGGRLVQSVAAAQAAGAVTLHFKDGTVASGEWTADAMTGDGKIVFVNGTVHTGTFLEGR